MADKKGGFLKDGLGQASSMRLMSFCSLFASMGFGYLTMMMKRPSEFGVYITCAFLLGAFAPKAIQKFIEEKK